MNLGKALVEELNLDPCDTLSRWMAHYISEQITILEDIKGDEKNEVEERCFETILKLWKHRSHLPNGPFKDYDAIFKVLEKIDPENNQPFYYKPYYADEVSEDVQRWLDMALGVDDAVRIILEYIFNQAAQCEKIKKYLNNSLAKRELEIEAIDSLINSVFLEGDEGKTDRLKQMKCDSIISRIKKLEYLNSISEVVLSDMKQILSDLDKC